MIIENIWQFSQSGRLFCCVLMNSALPFRVYMKAPEFCQLPNMVISGRNSHCRDIIWGLIPPYILVIGPTRFCRPGVCFGVWSLGLKGLRFQGLEDSFPRL